jgi:hypothetical protein
MAAALCCIPYCMLMRWSLRALKFGWAIELIRPLRELFLCFLCLLGIIKGQGQRLLKREIGMMAIELIYPLRELLLCFLYLPGIMKG